MMRTSGTDVKFIQPRKLENVSNQLLAMMYDTTEESLFKAIRHCCSLGDVREVLSN